MTVQKKQAPKKKNNSNLANVIVILIIAIGIVIFTFISVYALIWVSFAILPSFVVFMTERNPRHDMSKVIFAFNLAGIAPNLISLFARKGDIHTTAVSIILSTQSWMIIYALCGLGGLAYWALPNLYKLIIAMRIDKKKFKLNAKMKSIFNEWGEEQIMDKVNTLLGKKKTVKEEKVEQK